MLTWRGEDLWGLGELSPVIRRVVTYKRDQRGSAWSHGTELGGEAGKRNYSPSDS